MMALNYLVDTHVLHWHWAVPSKLPVRVRDIFAKASRGEVRLIISHIVMLELNYLYKKLGLVEQFQDRLNDVSGGASFLLEPVHLIDIEKLPDFEAVPEMHDRILAIQAARLGIPMITKDESITKSKMIETIWDS